MSISEVLHKIQKELNAQKKQYNSFGKYNYRSCEDIVEAVKKILPEGYALTLNDEVVMHGDRFYIKAEALLFSGEERVATNGYAREAQTKKGMDEAQVTGAASSYARKYALNGLFAIDDSKDADTDENQAERAAAKVSADREYAKKKLEQEVAIHDKLIGMIATIQTSAKVLDFERNQKITDLRDKLDLNNPELSRKVDAALKVKEEQLIKMDLEGE